MAHTKLMLTLRESSTETGLPYGFIRQLCLDEKIKYIRSGTKIYVNKDSLFAYCGSNNVENSAKSKITNFVMSN